VFLALAEHGPCTRQQLAAHVATQANQATVYRAVNFFIEAGVAMEVRPRLIELTDRFKQHHHHLVCNKCGKEISFHNEALERALERLAALRGFQVENHAIELDGLCRMCTNQKPAAASNVGRIRRSV
jgi:Fur family ferric uptake transcriptional regulator